MLLRGPDCPTGADPAVLRALAGQPVPAGVCGVAGQREEPVGVRPGRRRVEGVGGAKAELLLRCPSRATGPGSPRPET